MHGYMGKILRVDLSSGKISTEELDPQTVHEFIGGGGFATKIIYDEVPAGADPLSGDNRLVFMTGPVTGTRFPTSGRFVVAAKSPLTNLLTTAASSGFWGVELKKTGYDGIVFQGKADKPVYLEMVDDQVSLKGASQVWGKDSYETQDILIEKSGKKRARVACIGQAGEKLAPLACVMNDAGRAAGRGGLGAVMGAMNLKAILVSGSKKIQVAMDDFLKLMTKEVIKGIQADPFAGFFTKWGTAFSMDMGWAAGDVPIKNWQRGEWEEGCVNLGGAKMANTILKPHTGACHNCPIRCSRWVEIKEGKYAYEGPGPEYETLGAFGTMLMIDDLEAVSWLGELCNKYGLDTISAGCTVAWAMEAYEKGAITKEDTGGIELTWGNVDAVVKVTEQMGLVEGFGALLVQGSKKAAEKIGKGTEEYAIQVKGMEVPMHDPRCYHSLAVNYATGTRGACHVQGGPYVVEIGVISPEAGVTHRQGRFDKKGKGLASKAHQDLSAVYNSAAFCMFAGMGIPPSHIGNLLAITTGVPHNAQTVLQAGERIVNLQRAFACREGITRKDDTLPKRLVSPLPDGGSAGKAADLEFQLNEYYDLRQWDENGIPTKEKLEALGLSGAAKDLHT